MTISSLAPRVQAVPFLPSVVTGSNPAAGAEISHTVPDGEVWELHAVRVDLVTDANAANRLVAVTLDDGTTEFIRTFPNATQAASQTRKYTFVAGGGTSYQQVDGVFASLGTRPVLRPGYRIKTVTSNIQAGDDYGAPAFYVIKHVLGV